MGYSGEYTLGARCLTEVIGTMTYVFFMECLLANKLLPKTKAHDLTYGWQAFGVGFSVFVTVQSLGFISAFLNPAVALATAIAGQIDWTDWPYLALSEVLGAFLGSVVMWIYYLPQFETDPEPAPSSEQDLLLRSRDDMGTAALDFVSYSARLEARAPVSGVGLQEFGRLLSAGHRDTSTQLRSYRVVELLGRDAIAEPGKERRRSVMVPCIQHSIARLERKSTPVRLPARALSDTQEVAHLADESVIKVDAFPITSMLDSVELLSMQEEIIPERNDSSEERYTTEGNMETIDLHNSDKPSSKKASKEKMKAGENNALDPIALASSIADQNMKLAIFCTRPARYLPISNLITEIISTCYLSLGILCIKERAEFLYEGYEDVYKHGFIAFLIALLVFVIVLSLGGMGIATNPARDLAPRFAHWILPVSGKGDSEWYYGWITLTGPMLGATIAGYVFVAMRELINSQKDGRDFENEIFNLTSIVSQIWTSSNNSITSNP